MSKKRKGMPLLLLALLLLLLVTGVGAGVFFLVKDKITAASMRIVKTEGEVELEDKGKKKTIANKKKATK